jgi:hypothetical protein
MPKVWWRSAELSLASRGAHSRWYRIGMLAAEVHAGVHQLPVRQGSLVQIVPLTVSSCACRDWSDPAPKIPLSGRLVICCISPAGSNPALLTFCPVLIHGMPWCRTPTLYTQRRHPLGRQAVRFHDRGVGIRMLIACRGAFFY